MCQSDKLLLDDALIESARDVGANRFQIFQRIILPLAQRLLTIAFCLNFIGLFGSYTLPYLLGPAAPQMMGVTMQRTYNEFQEPRAAETQVVITFLMFQFGEQNDEAFFDWWRADACTIGHDVWIGHGATIMAGVSVGTGAMIGAGAVVTKPVEPYTIVVGVPAHPIRKRFSDDVLVKLPQIAWWEWDHATTKARFDDFLNMNTFIEKYGK